MNKDPSENKSVRFIFTGDQTSAVEGPQTKPCPFCAEIIQAQAIKCRFCGEFLNTSRARAIEPAPEPASQSDENEEQTDDVLFRARPSLWAMAGAIIKGLVFLGIAWFLTTFELENLADDILKLELTDNQAIAFGQYRFIAGVGLAILVLFILVIKMVRLKCTYYEVTEDRIEWSRGILDRRIDNLDMFRVVDLKLRRSLLDCILGIGTICLVTTDKSDPKFVFEKVHNCRRLYDIIKKASLDADRRSGVIHLE